MHPDGWPLEHVSIQIGGPRKPRCLEIEKFREPEKKEARAPPRTDLGAGCDRSRGGVRPISASGPSGSSGLSMPVRTRTLRQRPGHWLLQLQQTTTQGLSNRRRARVDAELGIGAQQVRLDGRLGDIQLDSDLTIGQPRDTAASTSRSRGDRLTGTRAPLGAPAALWPAPRAAPSRRVVTVGLNALRPTAAARTAARMSSRAESFNR